MTTTMGTWTGAPAGMKADWNEQQESIPESSPLACINSWPRGPTRVGCITDSIGSRARLTVLWLCMDHEVEPMTYLCPHRRSYVLHSPMSYNTISNFSEKNRSLILLMALEGMGTGL
jgi:hypothetical protein